MPIAQCPRCKGVFNKISALVCPKCQAPEEEDYERIRELMADHEERTVQELAEAADTDRGTVMRMLELGLISDIRDETFKCGRCGAPAISAARKLCQGCLSELDRKVSQVKNELLIPKTPADSVHSSVEAKRR